MKFLRKTFSDKVLLLITLLAVDLMLLGIIVSNSTSKAIFINLGTSFVIVVVTIALVENNRARELEKNLAPVRAIALEEMRDRIGSHIYYLYNLVGEKYFKPVAGELSKDNPRPTDDDRQNEWFYGLLAKVLDKLNEDPKYKHLSDVTEIQYLEVYKKLETIKEDIEKIKLQFSFGLDLDLNKRIWIMENMLKPKGTVYSLDVFTVPQNKPISVEGRLALSQIINAASVTYFYANKLSKSFASKNPGKSSSLEI